MRYRKTGNEITSRRPKNKVTPEFRDMAEKAVEWMESLGPKGQEALVRSCCEAAKEMVQPYKDAQRAGEEHIDNLSGIIGIEPENVFSGFCL